MQCPNCSLQIHPNIIEYSDIYDDERLLNPLKQLNDVEVPAYRIAQANCPACKKLIILLQRISALRLGLENQKLMCNKIILEEMLYPKYINKEGFENVPENLNNDYKEAAAILELSPKASAALSRRILQDIIQNHYEIKEKDLCHEIESFLLKHKNDLSNDLANNIDNVRKIGNFAAHPKKHIDAGYIIEVEPDEANWLLELVENLFDFAFIQPKRNKERSDALNKKLAKIAKK